MSAPVSKAITRLEVGRGELLDGLTRLFKALGRSRTGEALLRYQDGQLLIAIGGAECAVPATGDWSGEARVSSQWIRAVNKVPPPHDPVVIQVLSGRVRIGGSSMPCRWQVPGAATIEVPIGLDLRDLLRLERKHSEAELEKSGVASSIADARIELEKRVKAAARSLAPLGVTPADIRLLVVGKLGLGE